MHGIECFLLVLKFSDFFDLTQPLLQSFKSNTSKIHFNYKKALKINIFWDQVQITMENHMICFP